MDWNSLNISGFNKQAANVLAHASQDAYRSVNAKASLEKKWGCSVRSIEAEDTQAKVFFGKDAVIVSFRGTEDVEDWRTNLDVNKREVASGIVGHEGFADAYGAIEDQVIDVCEAANSRKVVLTGHSLGGGIANIAMPKLTNSGYHVDKMYTYGSPRVFDPRSSRAVDSMFSGRQFRVVNRNDIVPRVPSRLRFRHTGMTAYINRHDKIHLNPGLAYVMYDRILGYRANMIRSHFMKFYIKGTD